MANRGLLHRSQLDSFKAWLEACNYQILKPKGNYEVLRWKGDTGKPMPIVFDRHKGDHYTLNGQAEKFVRRFLKVIVQDDEMDFGVIDDIYGDLPDGAFLAIAEENGLI